jgi:hypothetical protein
MDRDPDLRAFAPLAREVLVNHANAKYLRGLSPAVYPSREVAANMIEAWRLIPCVDAIAEADAIRLICSPWRTADSSDIYCVPGHDPRKQRPRP